ncbi:glucans biosynthesis protein [Loktanella ponticola]|uniref:Glucans biosynthesis protein n=1 Tax=Yoonia ponticola TaxID=1524255 RepID=A0A7W9BII2_9RHOB|nr:glucan biosynthesis protein G [Yoonia ponticola]MBB5721101.1 glucans biosynthesis protein [Yoonia ponticola]
MISRRALLISMSAAAVAGPAYSQATIEPLWKPFAPEMVTEMARELAKSAYAPVPQIPQEWLDLTYDEFSHIWFDPRKAVWVGEDRPLKMDLFSAGLFVPRPAEVNIVQDQKSKTLPFNIDLFETTDEFPDLPTGETMGYSGFRLRTSMTTAEIFEEFTVFQGASYFRAIGNGQNYGLSARGLALRTADPDGEEFPDFTKFWVEAAEAGDTQFVVHALLDSPSTTGAYTFRIRAGAKGEPTVMDVETTLFPRVDLTHVGVAPLTSMFLFDETNRNRFDDFRPAVHDSEGLLIVNGNGETIWRPLANPTRVQISSFTDENPQGFGLMQRNRTADDYADLEAHYENRPSLWITPKKGWGNGVVELIEIPADLEIYDNIVAYWRPAEPLTVGSEHHFSYAMRWGGEPVGLPDVARVTNTRIGKGFDQVKTVFAIDFTDHPDLPDNLDDVTLTIRTNTGDVSPGVLQRNHGTGGVRLAFSLLPGDAQAVEMRAQLHLNGTAITEVWLYRWTI